MKAIKHPQTEIITVHDTDGPIAALPRFKRFVGGVGWANTDKASDLGQNWAIVVGEQEDNELMAMQECRGSIPALCKQMVDLKDQFLCLSWYCDAAEIHKSKVRMLRDYEGLTHYKFEKDVYGRKSYATPSDTWPHFRTERPLTSIAAVSDMVKMDLKAGYDRLREMIRTKEFGFYSGCPSLSRLMIRSFNDKRPDEESMDSPVVVAAVYAVEMLLRTRPLDTKKGKPKINPYPNRKR